MFVQTVERKEIKINWTRPPLLSNIWWHFIYFPSFEREERRKRLNKSLTLNRFCCDKINHSPFFYFNFFPRYKFGFVKKNFDRCFNRALKPVPTVKLGYNKLFVTMEICLLLPCDKNNREHLCRKALAKKWRYICLL